VERAVALDVQLRYLRPREAVRNAFEVRAGDTRPGRPRRARHADMTERTPATLAIKGGAAIETRLAAEAA